MLYVDQVVAELTATCPKCGPMTSYGLELAWRRRTVTCGVCSLSMRLGHRDPEVHANSLSKPGCASTN